MSAMKVAALIPFRNESRLLPCCLASLQGVADMVIGMDDHSSDHSGDIVRERGGIVLEMEGERSGFSQGKEKIIRQALLDEARRRGATHFFCIDADEVVTAPFRKYGRPLMEALAPGHKLALRWLTLWGSNRYYRDGDYSKFHHIYRGVIVRDSPDLPPYDGFLHMPRTPGSDERSNVTKCPLEHGALLHFTAAELLPYQMKIAWYHCVELVRRPDEAERINRFYFRDWDESHIRLRHIPDEWVEGIPLESIPPCPPSWQWAEICRLFDEKGVEFFEPLELWHIPQLREEFFRRTGRFPRDMDMLTRLRRGWRRERKRFDRWFVDMCRKARGESSE